MQKSSGEQRHRCERVKGGQTLVVDPPATGKDCTTVKVATRLTVWLSITKGGLPNELAIRIGGKTASPMRHAHGRANDCFDPGPESRRTTATRLPPGRRLTQRRRADPVPVNRAGWPEPARKVAAPGLTIAPVLIQSPEICRSICWPSLSGNRHGDGPTNKGRFEGHLADRGGARERPA